VFFPISIFLEKTKGADLWTGLAIQTGWLLLTWTAARTMFRRGVRHYQAFGG